VTADFFDWDLWPWTVAYQAGGSTGVLTYRMELGIRRMGVTIGRALIPAFRGLGLAALDAERVFQAMARALPWDPDALTS
jgi:hypothetical protein